MNGRISINDLHNNHVVKYGEKYSKKFKKNLDKKEHEILQRDKASMRSSYGNLIVWRNKFAHEGEISSTPTYEEVKKSYALGKNVIDCLANTMTR